MTIRYVTQDGGSYQEDDVPSKVKDEFEKFKQEYFKPEELEGIRNWILERFEEVANSKKKVQPTSWLGAEVKWEETPLNPIYLSAGNKFPASDDYAQEYAGKMFGVFVIETLIADERAWLCVKGDNYQANGHPIQSRIYWTT